MNTGNLRSLLASETLKQNAGVLVDLEVVHGRTIGRRGIRLPPGRGLERRL